jgi:hypothetical protein
MDQNVIDWLGDQEQTELEILPDGTAVIQQPGGARTVALKPLGALYGPGNPGVELDPTSETFMPLFLAIEETIVLHFRRGPSLTDNQVTQTLERIGLRPEADADAADSLGRELLLKLRLSLSISNYSRQELRAALRKIGKSVARHHREGGPQGYLQFIDRMLPG